MKMNAGSRKEILSKLEDMNLKYVVSVALSLIAQTPEEELKKKFGTMFEDCVKNANEKYPTKL